MQRCTKLANRKASDIASFLITKYNSEKVQEMIREFNSWGFTKESLVTDGDNLFKFLILISYDRRPFDKPDYYTVWDKNDLNSVYTVLEKSGIFSMKRIKSFSEAELKLILSKCVAHGYHLHNTNPNGNGGTNYAKTIKNISEVTNDIMQLLTNIQTSMDILKLHRKLCTIHGIKNTIAAKFIMYTVRELGIGNVPASQLEPIAFFLFGEWHNQKWAQRLEDPAFGGRHGLAEQLMEEMKSDPIAIDYFWQLDKEYCTKGKRFDCEL